MIQVLLADTGIVTEIFASLVVKREFNMERIVSLVVIILLLTGSLLATYSSDEKNEKKAIENVIWEFMDGCMNNYEEEAAIKCFHPDFNGLDMKNDSINVSTRFTFIEYVTFQKGKSGQSPFYMEYLSLSIVIINRR